MKRLAVLGHPVSHSRSPAMQNAALEALGLAGEWSYESIEVSREGFGQLLQQLPGEGFYGVNVTVPHKGRALTLASTASRVASEIGAANTLTFTEQGIAAENTDAPGLLMALPEPPADKRALVLGAGGAARAVVWALAANGADVAVWNRTPIKRDMLVDAIGPTVESYPNPGQVRGLKLEAKMPECEIVVNCTSVGMYGTSRADPFEVLTPLDRESLGPGMTVVDLVYGGFENLLIREARQRGATTVDGLEVLVCQGAESLRIWTGEDPPLDVMREAAREG